MLNISLHSYRLDWTSNYTIRFGKSRWTIEIGISLNWRRRLFSYFSDLFFLLLLIIQICIVYRNRLGFHWIYTHDFICSLAKPLSRNLKFDKPFSIFDHFLHFHSFHNSDLLINVVTEVNFKIPKFAWLFFLNSIDSNDCLIIYCA